jgi:hypothetical protein
VPKEAVTVNDSRSGIVSSDSSQCRYFAGLGEPHGLRTVSIDGSKLRRLNDESNVGLNQRVPHSNTLGPDKHTGTVTVTVDDAYSVSLSTDTSR